MYKVQNLKNRDIKFQGKIIKPYEYQEYVTITDYITLSRLTNSGSARYFQVPAQKFEVEITKDTEIETAEITETIAEHIVEKADEKIETETEKETVVETEREDTKNTVENTEKTAQKKRSKKTKYTLDIDSDSNSNN